MSRPRRASKVPKRFDDAAEDEVEPVRAKRAKLASGGGEKAPSSEGIITIDNAGKFSLLSALLSPLSSLLPNYLARACA